MKALKKITVNGLPFVAHVDQDKRPILELTVEQLKSCNDLNLYRTGRIKNLGYVYDFSPYLKMYLYKQYGHWHEIFAYNKTALRVFVCGKIDKIIEI